MSTILLAVIFLIILLVMLKPKTSFPGPARLPLIGCLPFLNLKRGMLDWILSDDVTKHQVSFVQIGHYVRVHVINDFQLAKHLFSLDIFSSRPFTEFERYHRFEEYDKPVGIVANNGEGWSTQRRFGLRTLRDFGFGKHSLESSINLEIDDLIENLTSNKGDMKIEGDFNLPIINILWQLVAGCRIRPDDKEGIRMIDLVQQLFKIGPLKTSMFPFPLAKLFPNISGYTEKVEVLDAQKAYMMKTIDEHNATLDPEHLRDLIDVYLLEMKEDTSGKYTRADLCIMMLDFFQAGTETSSTTIKWLVLFLTLNQEAQEKCRQEIRKMLGDRRPEIADMQHLPYTMAILTETQRLSCVAPASLPHFTTQDFTYAGHTYPKDSVVIANLSYIMKDPAYFKDPLRFYPERFIDEQGSFVKNERVIPFGIGKRFCMGELLARNEIFLFAVNFLQHLQFLAPDNHSAPDPGNYVANFTNIPADYYVKIKHLN